MSDMNLDVAFRMKIGEVESIKEAQDLVEPLFGKGEDEESFYYENKGKFNVAYIGNEVFLDYYIKDGESAFDVDITFDQKQQKEIETELENTFTTTQFRYFLMRSAPFAADAALRILYYYNGGCGGLREVK